MDNIENYVKSRIHSFMNYLFHKLIDEEGFTDEDARRFVIRMTKHSVNEHIQATKNIIRQQKQTMSIIEDNLNSMLLEFWEKEETNRSLL